MILNPAVIALILGSLLVSFMLIYASFFALRIIRRWNLKSGSEEQLSLERRTYLISTILGYALGFELISLFLYVYTAERMHTLFVGAMCAAGTLYVNPYGYPALLVKMVVFLLAGLWLVLNHADNTAWDYPLIRKKYAFLLVLVPLAIAGAVLQGLFFLNLEADVITSCCGSLFSQSTGEVRTEVLSFPGAAWAWAMYPLLGGVLVLSAVFLKTGRGVCLTGIFGGAAFITSLVGTIVHLSPYIYELPTHRCPFCLLQGDYHFVGYPIYLSLFGGAIGSLGLALLQPFRNIESLCESLPRIQKRLVVVSLTCFGIFLLVALWSLLRSNLVQ